MVGLVTDNGHRDRRTMSILVVEDDERGRRLLDILLRQQGYQVTAVGDAAGAFNAIATQSYDLMTVDLGLPDLGGMDVVAHVREVSDMPVVVVTGRSDLADVVTALSAGADDYIVKPVNPPEFAARVAALLRRAAPRRETEVMSYRDADVVVDFQTNEIQVVDRRSTMSDTERRLLRLLVGNAGRVMTHDDILRRVWGQGYEDAIANLHVYVNQLRRKIEPIPTNPRYIETHRGVGYRFVPSPDGSIA